MKLVVLVVAGAAALVVGIAPSRTFAQQPPGPRPLVVGNRLGLPVEPAADGTFAGISSNVKVYGAIYSAESCSYDAEPGKDVLGSISGRVDEEVGLGRKEIYVLYGANMARSKLKIPGAANGTARNMNTVAKLASMAAADLPKP